jgi:hypothetical protein
MLGPGVELGSSECAVRIGVAPRSSNRKKIVDLRAKVQNDGNTHEHCHYCGVGSLMRGHLPSGIRAPVRRPIVCPLVVRFASRRTPSQLEGSLRLATQNDHKIGVFASL